MFVLYGGMSMEEFCIFMSKSCPWDLITLSPIFILLFEDTVGDLFSNAMN
jgi:hypothetical protein